jgi:hypothetical protein
MLDNMHSMVRISHRLILQPYLMDFQRAALARKQAQIPPSVKPPSVKRKVGYCEEDPDVASTRLKMGRLMVSEMDTDKGN